MANTVLSKTAQGATFLILLQIASRGLTFIVNQILLRFLTPKILGVANQLELFCISTLYLARESIRVSVQRQGGAITEPDSKTGPVTRSSEKDAKNDHTRRIQEVVNLSWIAVGLGVILTFVFTWLYLRKADTAMLEIPWISTALPIYSLAIIVEALNEPCFAIAQQQMLYAARASSEMLATFSRCVVTCAIAIGAIRSDLDIGVLPFALGQLTYASVLNVNYLYRVSSVCKDSAISRAPKAVGPKGEHISEALFFTSCNLYGQSLFKQLLTSGDQYLIAILAPLSAQGSYALASNYGSLLARVLFQPLEESSRPLFARLLPPHTDPANEKSQNLKEGTQQASSYLARLLHAYLLLSLFALSLGPPLSRPLLHLLAGSSWSNTEAPAVLAAYCYYIPMLALNGVLEAYVAAVATPAQLRIQSLWMVAFSALFALVGAVVLGLWDMGARGLVLANVVTMAGRVVWSWRFVTEDIRKRGGDLSVSQIMPSYVSFAIGVGSRSLLENVGLENEDLGSLVRAAATVATCGLGV